ncbi:hypothetical protein [Chryseolinea lacunae]|uniref:DUF3592 domain-containing protein n=1 Tax=Chryseolinea lacunae TaxID=2801331 RepID=A0ABS1L0Y1_9BACT|nr:hypothetical protein [Chryseolinea lacunae]MBL0745366.1 hypothetical protein [Chryseolinea lacunae]
MKSRNGLTVINISLVICLLAAVMVDFWLSRFGQAFMFQAKMPRGITIEHDKLQGYKILEEGFIHILDDRTIHGKDTLAAILAYHATESNVFVKSKTTTGKIIYLDIHLLSSADPELKYELTEYKNTGNEEWIDISNKQSIRPVVIFRNALASITFLLFIGKLFRWIKSAFFSTTLP